MLVQSVPPEEIGGPAVVCGVRCTLYSQTDVRQSISEEIMFLKPPGNTLVRTVFQTKKILPQPTDFVWSIFPGLRTDVMK